MWVCMGVSCESEGSSRKLVRDSREPLHSRPGIHVQELVVNDVIPEYRKQIHRIGGPPDCPSP